MLIRAHPGLACSVPDAQFAWTIDLTTCRPKPVSATDRAKVVKSLPANGSVLHFGRQKRGKLEAVKKVLRLHDREEVYEIRVIAVPQVWTGLHERAVLLITLPALTLLQGEELQALVAHEIGHEYVWEEYVQARVQQDRRRIRELELACDVIAIRTLMQMGLRPKLLQSAMEKALRYNRERFGVARNEDDYPSLQERRQLLERRFVLERRCSKCLDQLCSPKPKRCPERRLCKSLRYTN